MKHARDDRTHALRRRKVMRQARSHKPVDAILISQREDVSYLTGFTGEDSTVIVSDRWTVLVTDGRYGEQAYKECPDIDVLVRRKAMPAAVARALDGRRVRRLGVQAESMTLHTHRHLSAAVGGRKIVPLTDVTASQREVKDAGEIRSIRKAIRIAERAFKTLLIGGADAIVGRTERDVAGELDYLMRQGGASAPSFETIVAAGAHSSQPHYRPGSTRIRRDQAVLFDWGAFAGGYCSDLTRVVFTGRIPPELAEVYEVVRRAQAAGIAAMRPGVACGTVDAAARRVIADAGFGEQFVHGLGHGIGRAIHESPAVGRALPTRLRTGMVVTVEPGIYLPAVGGVRIEDDVLIMPEGGRRLSTLPRALAAMRLAPSRPGRKTKQRSQ